MKTITMKIKRKRFLNSKKYLQVWILIFIIGFIYGILPGNSPSVLCLFIGLPITLILYYINNKTLKKRGNVLSEIVVDKNTVKNTFLYLKIVFVFFLLISGFIFVGNLISTHAMNIDFLLIFIFILSNIYRKLRFYSSFIKNK